MTKNYDVQVLIDELKIKNRIKDLSSEINQFYTNTNKLLVVGLLRGSFVFIADLAREIKVPVEIDFMTVFPLLLSSDFSIEESYSLYSFFASGVSIEEYELFQS